MQKTKKYHDEWQNAIAACGKIFLKEISNGINASLRELPVLCHVSKALLDSLAKARQGSHLNQAVLAQAPTIKDVRVFAIIRVQGILRDSGWVLGQRRKRNHLEIKVV